MDDVRGCGGGTVPKIFDLRVKDLLSYRAIAGYLNQDLETWAPPQPVDPERAVGRWTPSSVREVLINPKYTGFMVWNRRATKDKRHPGKNNPKDQWIISGIPTHKALVDMTTFLAAQELVTRRAAKTGRERHRSDLDVMAANPHPAPRTHTSCGRTCGVSHASDAWEATRTGMARSPRTASLVAGTCPPAIRSPSECVRTH